MTRPRFDPSQFNHQTAVCGGYNYHYVDEGNKAGITVMLIHGFPDLCPKTIASHLVALLDHLNVAKAVMIGHDWGTGIVSRVGWHYPDRVLAAIAIGNPFRPITEHFITMDDFVCENPAFQYFEYFVSDEAITDFEARLEDIIEDQFSDEAGSSAEDRLLYIESLKKGGFQGPLAYYKTLEESYQEDLCLVGQRFKIPTLLLIVVQDSILPVEYCRQVPQDYFDDLEVDLIEEGEHWILTQNPTAVNKKIGDYLQRVLGQSRLEMTAEISSRPSTQEQQQRQQEQEQRLKLGVANHGGTKGQQRYGFTKL
ncbi:Bifunctional epoxide hydrolase 2 [Mortierella claussenii]|nr:Bifunctional epoxide hydrolase 2 [Mortierella claussenii]